MKTIKILGHDVSVRVVPALDLNGQLGNSCVYNNEICISKEAVSETTMCATLWHEVLEHIRACVGLELSHEALSIIAELQYQVLKDNPDLFEWE